MGSPAEYRDQTLSLRLGQNIDRDFILRRLTDIQYDRNDLNFTRGTFRVRGDVVEIFPASYGEKAVRVELFGEEIERIVEVDTITGEILTQLRHVSIFPANHYVTGKEKMERALVTIEQEMEERLTVFRQQGKLLEAQRLEQRTRFDLEMMREVGFCTGIENYSRHLTGRKPGESPYTLMDFFPKDFLLMIDESHVTIPQIGAMYAGDRSRKETLVEHGFRLPSALDNRPLKFAEFTEKLHQVVYLSATPRPYEEQLSGAIVEQINRPTGLLDPEIVVRPTKGQMDHLLEEIKIREERKERVLITTLTKKMAEALTDYLREMGIKVRYLHSEVKTLERMQIIRDLRLGVFDVLVGINLLREGLDLPEVSLVAILDADKEGFLRSERSLIQTIGRAARNVRGQVIMYADVVTDSMRLAIEETERRRRIQSEFNQKHGIVPQTVQKEVRDVLEVTLAAEEQAEYRADLSAMPRQEIRKLIARLEKDMQGAAKELAFERAAELRDIIIELKSQDSKVERNR